MHREGVLDGARQTIFCPSAIGLGYFRAKLQLKGAPKVFTSPLLLPLQGLLRKNYNSKPKFLWILTLCEGDIAPPARFALQEKESPSAACCQPSRSRSASAKIYTHQGKSAVKNKREASRHASDRDQR